MYVLEDRAADGKRLPPHTVPPMVRSAKKPCDQGDRPCHIGDLFPHFGGPLSHVARDCGDYFAKEEFDRLAREFQTKADELEIARVSISSASGPVKPEQARGFETEGDR